jgi:hypothetical protein
MRNSLEKVADFEKDLDVVENIFVEQFSDSESVLALERRTMYIPITFLLIRGLTFDGSRLVDWRILPLLGLVFSVSLIDRNNLGFARVAGMGADLVSSFIDLGFD